MGAPVPPKGYHPIASWMSALELGDDLCVERAIGKDSSYDLAFTQQCPRKLVVDWPLEKDLCVRAHRLLELHVGRALPVKLTLRKNVPSGGGLGGGSSDAAYTLIAINELFSLQLDQATLLTLALQLGSDVPYFIGVAMGQSSALVTGLGELLEPLPMKSVLTMVLVFPDFGTPTGAVYGAFDKALADPAKQAEANRIRKLAELNPLPHDAPFNDLAEPACNVTPALKSLRAQLQTLSPYQVHITGSGSTMFILTPDIVAAQSLSLRLGEMTRLEKLATLVTRNLPGR
ncbi:MAG: hypothetical protein HC898_09805 [Phycisphaerales bacterium]|nr:hypothetical protein [Phycisphaerales bacterium]